MSLIQKTNAIFCFCTYIVPYKLQTQIVDLKCHQMTGVVTSMCII